MSSSDNASIAEFGLPAPSQQLTAETLAQLHVDPREMGVLIVDHGSRRAESNDLLLEVTRRFQQVTQLPIVEPAHMELAEPSIAQAFASAVAKGATAVVVHPYFLAPGRHWRRDIPQLVADAAASHPSVKFLVTAPLGLHPLMLQIMQDRILQCLHHSLTGTAGCDVCADELGCAWKEDARH